MGDTAYIPSPVFCDFCQMQGKKEPAQYDGATKHGPWAYMCEQDFQLHGVGLGTGRGQRLIVGERPDEQSSPENETDEKEVNGTDESLTEPETSTNKDETASSNTVEDTNEDGPPSDTLKPKTAFFNDLEWPKP